MKFLQTLLLIALLGFAAQGTAWAKDKKHEVNKHEDNKHEDKKHEDNKHEDKKNDQVENHFIEGQCTWFVAQRVQKNWKINVSWRGNAESWLENAKEKGFHTGSKPKKDSIVVFKAVPGMPPEKGGVGHVAWVKKVDGNKIRIEEMNYTRGPGNEDEREVNVTSNTIKGYIYEN